MTPAELSVSTSVASQIHIIAQAAYALEAELIGCADFPPLRESLWELQHCFDRFLVFQEPGGIAGALSFKHGADSVFITRLVVSPTRLRQGIATALLSELERQLPQAAHLKVSTAQANTPAVLFYKHHGFTVATTSQSAEGILLLHLTKSIA